jgi:hypothetical protein
MASRLIAMHTRPEPENRRAELLRSAPLNSWVALSADETKIVATGSTFMEADAVARKSGERDFVITKTPEAWMPRALSPLR